MYIVLNHFKIVFTCHNYCNDRELIEFYYKLDAIIIEKWNKTWATDIVNYTLFVVKQNRLYSLG